MKKLSTYLFLIFFGFSAPSFADDISDLQIEGMSIGDSVLDYFTEEAIKKNTSKEVSEVRTKKFYDVNLFELSHFETYDIVQITLKFNDKNYKILNYVLHILYILCH